MNRTGKWAKRAVWLTLAAVLSFGCSPLTSIAFLLHKDDKVPAKYPLRHKDEKDAPKKEAITVAILTSQQGAGGDPEFARVDQQLARDLAKLLPEFARPTKQKIEVVPPSKMDQFKLSNRNWRSMRASEIGKKLGADFVLDIALSRISIYQPGSANQIYEGRAEVSVDVYDVSDAGEPIHHYIHNFLYPKAGFRDATTIPAGQFRMEYVGQLAKELALYHVEHPPSTGIAEQ
jgi:hypothetical protein